MSSSERSTSYSRPPRSSRHGRPPSQDSRMDPSIGTGSFGSSSDSPFQMTDIFVSVDVMEGLIMEYKDKTYDSYQKANSQKILGNLPITTFVSCKKNVSSTRTIATNVPSLPLSKPSSSHGGKHHHFLVRWPADFDPHGDALSTFKLSRLMKKESSSYGFGYIPEEVELTIGLMRGSEMITLGLANLVITGEETEDMVIDLPINRTKEAVKESKNLRRSPSPLRKLRSSSKSSMKVLKPTAFPSDPKRKYRLSEQSMIRLQVKISAQGHMSTSSVESDLSSSYVNERSKYDIQEYHSQYGNSSARIAPMDELQDDFNSQMRIKNEDRVFGEEIPRLAQTNLYCGPNDYAGAVVATPREYGLRNINSEIERPNYPNDGMGQSKYHAKEVESMHRHHEDAQLPPRKDVIVHSSSYQSHSGISSKRSGSRPRTNSNTRVSSRSRNSVSTSAGSRQSSRSTQRSSSRNKSRMQDPHVNPDSMLYVHSQNSMKGQNIRNKDYPDENNAPRGMADWFFENVIGHEQEAGPPRPKTSHSYTDSKTVRHNSSRPKSRREKMPPLSRNPSTSGRYETESYSVPNSNSVDRNEYYTNSRQQYYDYENELHDGMNPSRRISSMR